MTPQVQQNVPPAPGAMPRGRNLVIVGAALLIVVLTVVSSFTSATSRPATPAPVLPAAMSVNRAPTSADITTFTRQLQAEDERLRAQQAEASRLAMGAQSAGMEPGPVHGSYAYPAAQSPAGAAPAPVEPTKSALEVEREKRRVESLYASNLALQFGAPAPPTSVRQAQVTIPAPVAATGQGSPAPAAPDKGEPGAPLYTLTEGTLIPAVLTNRLAGQFAGPVNCQVTYDV